MKDKIAEHNRQMWERLAKAGMNYTRPFGRPPKTKAGMRRFMDPRGRLKGVKLDGARVLGLAAGGGWDPVIFAKLGATTTLFDISPTQLKTVRDLAARERVKVRLVRGNMKDLSVFKDEAFDAQRGWSGARAGRHLSPLNDASHHAAPLRQLQGWGLEPEDHLFRRQGRALHR
jgi:2-polyprenyl-3-methyl-5-hydroxy-6-metoxy-1,4-benzoquinol methylase